MISQDSPTKPSGEMMAAAVDGPDARPGMVAVIQTFSSSLKFNPHIHAIVTRGVFLL